MNVHDRVVEQLVEENLNRPLIDNTWRGTYVEYLVWLALSTSDAQWGVTQNWDPWDIEHKRSGARVEVKQSAARQTWTEYATPKGSPSHGFDIGPRTGYWPPGVDQWIDLDPPQRLADVYVFAWHDERKLELADHRDPDQWDFFVVPECKLPAQKSISLNPLKQLSEPVSYDRLSDAVQGALTGLDLKAECDG